MRNNDKGGLIPDSYSHIHQDNVDWEQTGEAPGTDPLKALPILCSPQGVQWKRKGLQHVGVLLDLHLREETLNPHSRWITDVEYLEETKIYLAWELVNVFPS